MDYNIYIKLTNACNLKCKHCYNEIMKNHKAMSDETLKKVIQWLKTFREEHKESVLNISLHGGEPMTYNLDKTLYLVDSTSDLNLKWCITTNLIYELTEKHINFFKKMKPFDNNSMIMTSYDYGDLRFKNNEQETLWKNNVKILVENDIDVQPIVCVTQFLLDNINSIEIYDFFKELGIKRFNFERITNTGRALENHIKPLNRNVDEWLFNAYKEYKKTNLICPLFEGIEYSFKGIFLGCRARHCMESVITINPDGSIASCPNMANKLYGNLDKIDNEKHCELIDFERRQNVECLMCAYYKYCNGDCCQLSFDDSGCGGLKSIYNYIENN